VLAETHTDFRLPSQATPTGLSAEGEATGVVRVVSSVYVTNLLTDGMPNNRDRNDGPGGSAASASAHAAAPACRKPHNP